MVAAQGRVQALLDRLARVDLQVAVVTPPDATRIAARDRAKTAAIAHGRLTLFDHASAAAREMAIRGFGRSGYSGTWALTEMSMSVATPRDRLSAAAAFEEAAMAAVVEDIAGEETVGVLRSTSNGLGNLTGLTAPGSIAAIASPTHVRGPLALGLLGILVVVLFASGLGAVSVLALALAIALLAALMRRRQPEL